MKKIDKLYQYRFSKADKIKKNKIWRILCNSYFQKFIDPNFSVLDVGAGYGEFINNIKAQQKFAIDLNPDTKKNLNNNIIFYLQDASNMNLIKTNTMDLVFVSNFFEHLPSKTIIDKVLVEVHRILKPNGLFLMMQPNIRYEPNRYWDYYDHIIPLSHLSLREAVLKANFKVIKIIPKFLPFSTDSKLPKFNFLIWLYLKLPILWFFFGKQCLLILRK